MLVILVILLTLVRLAMLVILVLLVIILILPMFVILLVLIFGGNTSKNYVPLLQWEVRNVTRKQQLGYLMSFPVFTLAS